jgi:hypothetical protein
MAETFEHEAGLPRKGAARVEDMRRLLERVRDDEDMRA